MKRVIFKSIVALAVISLACVLYGLLIEPRQLKIRQVAFVSDKYSGPEVRIGLITDIHIGGMHVPPDRVAKLVRDMNALNPDIVLLPGDFIDGHIPHEDKSDAFNDVVMSGMSHLGALQAPAFATLGNHDAWYGAAKVQELLADADISILENSVAIFEGLCLVGLADYDTATPDKSAFLECPQDVHPLVFTHSPQAYESFRSDTVLAVAGHTHGGQVNLPLIGRRVNSTRLSAEHSYGFSELRGVDVFVSAGVGTSILPVRFRSPPEIVLITLQPAPE